MRFMRRGRSDAERALEMQAHIEHHIDDLMAMGYSREAASREAHRRFGNPVVIREELHDMNSMLLLESLFRDLRYAGRVLRKAPGFALVVVITLALGVGVNTAVFSVVYGHLLKPLPYPDPDRLALVVSLVRSPGSSGDRQAVDGRMFLTIRDHATTVYVAASGGSFGVGANLVAGEQAANVRQGRVSAGYFGVLGVTPFLGREFNPDEDRPGGAPVAVLSHALWTRVFGASSEIVGRRIQLRGEPHTVIGVMPAGFSASNDTDVWTPLYPALTGEGGGANYRVIARLRDRVSHHQAAAELARLGSSVTAGQFPDGTSVTWGLVPLQQAQTTAIRQPLLMLWGAVGLVLLIACVNVAGLLIARSGTRTREIATRMALGSGRRAVMRQLLIESAVLALLGGVVGVGVGWVVLEGLKNVGQTALPSVAVVELDATVLLATLGLALLTSVVFGLVPAWQSARVDVHRALASSGTRAIAGGSGQVVRRLLVVAQVSMSVVLLVGAGLLVRTFVQLRNLDPGFDPRNVITATVSLQDARYVDAERVHQLFAMTLARIRQLPGVEAAGVSLGLPYTRLLNMAFRPLDGASSVEPGAAGMVNLVYLTPGYFETLRIPVRRGRVFSDIDSAGSLPVAIVNEEFVSKYYKGQGMTGRRINTAGSDREVIGVVGNVRTTSSGFSGYTDPLVAPPIVYVPAAQTAAGFLNLVHTWFAPAWVVRATTSPETVTAGVRQVLAEVDPLLPIAKFERISDVQSTALSTQRFMMSLMLGLGVVALLLAAVGIHGLIASSVTERTRELGIRLALGATPSQALRTVVVSGMLLATIGVALGGAAAWAVARLLQSFLWGVAPTDAMTFGAVTVTLLAVACVASLVPALRVLRLDPALTLRAE